MLEALTFSYVSAFSLDINCLFYQQNILKYLFGKYKRVIFVVVKRQPHWFDWETHQFYQKTETGFSSQWRATPSGSIYVGGLQRGRALKSCHSEFRHIYTSAVFIFTKKRC